jgi:hypothetical protein
MQKGHVEFYAYGNFGKGQRFFHAGKGELLLFHRNATYISSHFVISTTGLFTNTPHGLMESPKN